MLPLLEELVMMNTNNTSLVSILPIASFKGQIISAVRENAVVIITAETGAGKSTQVPQFLLEDGHQLVVTQPRRLAARSVAERVAEEMGVELGGVVGYRTAIERQDSKATKCLFCTDGLALVRELMGQNKGILVLDEVHEWNENMEVLVAWAKMCIANGADFKVVLMSATMEAEKLSAFFDGAPVITVPGRMFPVENQQPARKLEEDVAALLQKGRNVLVFQPGKREIGETIAWLEEQQLNAEILPLHGELSSEEQKRCFRFFKRPKCVVSTNVAQTSVTIADIDAVVDSGMERRIELENGVEGLYLRPISQADAKQRKGRAGRVKEGIYIDHCSASNRPDFPVAEILRKRLDQTVLRLAIAGFNMEEMEFFHQPAIEDIRDAKRVLVGLGCMTKDGKVTAIGKLVNKLPLSVKYARMLIEADRLGVVDDVLTAAAILECKGITIPTPSRNNPDRPDWRRMVPSETESDVMAQLQVWNMASTMNKDDMRNRGVSVKDYFRAQEIRRSLVRALDRQMKLGTTGSRVDILKAVCAGMVDHMYKGSYGSYRNGDDVSREIGTNSVVKSGEWVVGNPFDLEIQTRRGKMVLNLIEMVSQVDPAWLVEVAPQLAESKTGINARYDAQKDMVVSTTQLFFNGQMVKEEVVDDVNHPEASAVFAEWLVWMTSSGKGSMRPDLAEVLVQNQARIAQTRELNTRAGEGTFKVFSSNELLEHYRTALLGARRMVEIKNVSALALPALDPELVNLALEENPTTMIILGKEHVVEYRCDYSGHIAPPLVRLDQSLVNAHKWIELPDDGVKLPSGRAVTILMVINGTMSNTDIRKLKVQARSEANADQWNRWNQPEIQIPDPSNEDANIPLETAVYGTCVVSGAELKTFGTVQWDSWYGRFKSVWFKEIDQAKMAAQSAQEIFDGIKERNREQRRIEEARAEVEKARGKLADLQNQQGWDRVDYGLRCEVSSKANAWLPSSAAHLQTFKGEVDALIKKAEKAFEEVKIALEAEARAEAERQERVAQGGKRLFNLLQSHVSKCPFCGTELEWEEDRCGWLFKSESLGCPCQCYPEDAAHAIDSGFVGETISCDGRTATVLKRLMVGDVVALEFVLYYKYGCWNVGVALHTDAVIADGDVTMKNVWHTPTEADLRICELKRFAENYQYDRERAEEAVSEGYAFVLSFREGKHPKTGATQWEAGSNRGGIKYVLDRNSAPVKAGVEYFCREVRTLVETPTFKLIAVDAYLPVTTQAEIEAEIAFLQSQAQETSQSHSPESQAPVVAHTFLHTSGRYFKCTCGLEERITVSEMKQYEAGEAVKIVCTSCGSVAFVKNSTHTSAEPVVSQPEPEAPKTASNNALTALMGKFNKR